MFSLPKCLLLTLLYSSIISASDIPDVEIVPHESRPVNRNVIASFRSIGGGASYHHHRALVADVPSLRSHRSERETLASPVTVVVVNNVNTERTASRRVSNPSQARMTTAPTYRLPDDIQGLYRATQGSDKGRSAAAFDELKKRAKEGAITAMDFVSLCYINGYGCLVSEHWSNYWQDKYDRAKRRR